MGHICKQCGADYACTTHAVDRAELTNTHKFVPVPEQTPRDKLRTGGEINAASGRRG